MNTDLRAKNALFPRLTSEASEREMTMFPYIGNGEYCFANSLHMSLLGSGVPPESLPSPSFLECLTTIPFGNTYLKDAEIFFFCGPDPDFGRTRVLEMMGWTCQVECDGTEEAALARLRAAAQHDTTGPTPGSCRRHPPRSFSGVAAVGRVRRASIEHLYYHVDRQG